MKFAAYDKLFTSHLISIQQNKITIALIVRCFFKIFISSNWIGIDGESHSPLATLKTWYNLLLPLSISIRCLSLFLPIQFASMARVTTCHIAEGMGDHADSVSKNKSYLLSSVHGSPFHLKNCEKCYAFFKSVFLPIQFASIATVTTCHIENLIHSSSTSVIIFSIRCVLRKKENIATWATENYEVFGIMIPQYQGTLLNWKKKERVTQCISRVYLHSQFPMFMIFMDIIYCFQRCIVDCLTSRVGK